MWILGNGATLLNSGSVWQKVVMDAKKRGCYYNAYEDMDLCLAIRNYIIEFGQLNSLFTPDSILFKLAKWKVRIHVNSLIISNGLQYVIIECRVQVCFGPKFHESIARVNEVEIKKEVVSLLVKLSNGFHEYQKDGSGYLEGASSLLLKCSVVTGHLRLVWTIDILRDNEIDTQVIRVLDVLPRSQIVEVAVEFDILFGNYTVIQMSRCLAKQIEG